MAPPGDHSRGPDTIRILIATDSHVGYAERDIHRGEDSAKTFHEVMSLAKEHDVDMVLHGGDLFHENQPSRKSMYQVMRALRMNCLGDKPCELEMLSDASQNFGGVFDHVNYEDPDINVSIPVFAIHGNHDDPSGHGSFSALDLLQVSGLVNYYGRQPQTDAVEIKPVLLQKGRTKLALYGLSNIRDERLFRNFRDGHVKFFQPSTVKDEWFNLMTVHQNHHAYTETGYLPENFLPEFVDFVVWGHEHECLIEPRYNPEMGFHVMQPGSSVATSLMPGEAVPKHVAIMSITGKEFHTEPIRLKSVRPFVMKEIVLAEEKAIKEQHLWRKTDNKTKITQHLEKIVVQMIEDAKKEWLELQDERELDEDIEVPRPLVRLRVEYTAPEGGQFNCENPQRFSSRFSDQVANTSDVVQFHRKKNVASRTLKKNAELPDQSVLDSITLSTVRMDELVKEFLTAQSLTILPQNSFGDAVAQFVDKDDKQAMEQFVIESLDTQLNHLMATDEGDEEDIVHAMEEHKAHLETLFANGQLKRNRKRKVKPNPDWNSDLEGESWADQPGALALTDGEEAAEDGEDSDLASILPKPAARGRGKAAATSRKTAAAPQKAAPKAASKAAPARRGRGKRVFEESDEEDEDIIMIDDDDDEEDESQGLFVSSKPSRSTTKKPTPKPAPKAPARAKSPAKKPAPRVTKQSTLTFSQPSSARTQQPSRAAKGKKVIEPEEDEISDDDDFEPITTTRSTRRR